MSYYIGSTPENLINTFGKRYFYGIRRNDDGTVTLGVFDQLGNESITINNPGNSEDDYPNFLEDQDFLEGRDVDHEIVYNNLNFEQFRWDDRKMTYFINDNGEFVIRIN